MLLLIFDVVNALLKNVFFVQVGQAKCFAYDRFSDHHTLVAQSARVVDTSDDGWLRDYMMWS